MTTLIRALIVDDELLVREALRDALSVMEKVEIIGECADGLEAVIAARTLKPTVMFLDVQMPGMNGFSVVRELAPAARPAIVFVTAYDEYAVQAFEINAVDYLLKPFDDERVQRAVERARERLSRNAEAVDERLERLLERIGNHRRDYAERFIAISSDGTTSGRMRVVQTKEIEWIEAADNYVCLHVKGTRAMLRETMKTILARLDPQRFARIHRSAIVNLTFIKHLAPLSNGDYELILQSGRTLTISRTYREQVLNHFK